MPAASCSTGEQKAMLIAITLAHAELAAAGRPGVLLLDEVAAHLDPVRREALFERLRSGQAQAWLTGTDDELKELGDTFDSLLDRLEGSFRAQRRFIANASHEATNAANESMLFRSFITCACPGCAPT